MDGIATMDIRKMLSSPDSWSVLSFGIDFGVDD